MCVTHCVPRQAAGVQGRTSVFPVGTIVAMALVYPTATFTLGQCVCLFGFGL